MLEHKNTEGVGVAVTLEVFDLNLGQDTGYLRIVVFLSPCRQIRGYYID